MIYGAVYSVSQRVSYLINFTKVYKIVVEFVLLVPETASVESLIPTLQGNNRPIEPQLPIFNYNAVNPP